MIIGGTIAATALILVAVLNAPGSSSKSSSFQTIRVSNSMRPLVNGASSTTHSIGTAGSVYPARGRHFEARGQTSTQPATTLHASPPAAQSAEAAPQPAVQGPILAMCALLALGLLAACRRSFSTLASPPGPVLRNYDFDAETQISMAATTGAVEDPDQKFRLPAPAIFVPYIGTGYRKTVCRELVPGRIWGFEQAQTLSALSVNIRCTVIKLDDGKLWVHSPVFPTPEFLRELDALGDVAHIVLPTFALEHKLPIIEFSKAYPKAEVWAVPDTWAWPINIPLGLLGVNLSGGLLGTITASKASWAKEIDVAILKIDDVGSPFVEAAFLHKPTKSLLLTDTLYCIPSDPPAVVDAEKLLEVAPDDPTQPLPDTPENRRQGWAKMGLLVSFFIPARQRLVKGGKAEWQAGYMDSFQQIANKLIVSPILRALVLEKSTTLILPWLDEITSWDFDKVIPAHYDAPVKAGPKDVRDAFSFVDGNPDALKLPEDDMKTLNDLKSIVKAASSGEGGEVYTMLFDKFFKNLFLEKSGWIGGKGGKQ